MEDDDVWFSFVAATADPVIEVGCSASFDGVLELFDACGGASLGCLDNSGQGTDEIGFASGLTIGSTYFIRVYDYTSGLPATTNFTVCVYSLPPPRPMMIAQMRLPLPATLPFPETRSTLT